MNDFEKIAELLFPNVKLTIKELENRFPKRDLKENAQVTRFAPSPTGFVHIGAIYASLICDRIAHQSDGIFILRVEDTDKAREVEGGVEKIADALHQFDIPYDEGVFNEDNHIIEKGAYGPYKQSERRDIYAACAKYLVSKGLAYPCFCTNEELTALRTKQEKEGVKPGYYGTWAKDRDLTYENIKKSYEEQKPFAIRIKAPADINKRITFNDVLKGSITMPENDQDYVLLKSDGLPTYHFAHPIDDHFMQITSVLRGDEWLSSTPLHLQIFSYFGWDIPIIGHFATMQKMDGESKRKLSKRKDPEADVTYYSIAGYPIDGVKEYLLNIANSNFENWRRENPSLPFTQFPFSVSKMHASGALLDMVKLEDVCKQYIAKLTPEETYNLAYTWAIKYEINLSEKMHDEKEYTLKILSIEKDQKGKRKDLSKWSELKDTLFYFYDDKFEEITKDGYAIPNNVNTEDMKKVFEQYLPQIKIMYEDKNVWFDVIKKIAETLNYTTNTKEYKLNPQNYKGYVGDIAMFFRIALTNRINTPDLQEIMKTMGEERVEARLKKIIAYLSR